MFCKIAEMRHRITIQRVNTYTDSEGNIIENLSPDLITVWAKILPSASKISNGYLEKVQEVTYRIIFRYDIVVKVTDKILWADKVLEITAPPYLLDGRKKFWAVEARELIE